MTPPTSPQPDPAAPAGSDPSPSASTESPAAENDAAPSSGPGPVSPDADPLQTLQRDADHWKDMAYRNAAELDNFRKRSAREAQEARAYANADLLRGLIPILDNFEMGLEAARAESEKSMIFMGMTMVQRQIAEFLRDQGVQEIEALGKPFDPNLHDAVAQEPSPEAAEGTVLRVNRRGYKLKDRLLRAASVVVSSGPAAG